MDHVIWTSQQILKLASYFEMFIYFFVFCWIEKMDELQNDTFIEITQSFLYLEGAPKYILSAPLKKEHNNKNILIFDNNFDLSWKSPSVYSLQGYKIVRQ